MADYDTCGAKNREGDACGLPSGWGTDDTDGRCKLHGGATPSGPEAGAYTHGLYSEALREEDVALLERVEKIRNAMKLEDVLNLQIVRLFRAVEQMGRDPAGWGTVRELVEELEDPSSEDLEAIARILSSEDRAIREQIDSVRKLAKDLHKITEGETLRLEHSVEDGAAEEIEELQSLAEDLF